MALPANLSPSPFQEVFSELFERRSVAEAVQRRLGLNDDTTADADDFGMLRTADQHVIGWTLSRHDDASRYVRLLVQSISRLLDNFEKQQQESNGRRPAPSPAAVGIDATPLSLEEARQWLTGGGAPATRNDHGAAAATNKRKSAQLMDVVLLHYAVARLCEIVRALQELSANRKKRPTTTTTTTNGGGGGTDERRRRRRINGTIPSTKGDSEARSGATMATTFYPDGVLLSDWQPLVSLLSSPVVDSFVQRTFDASVSL
jgi:hypothetical protein